MKRKYYLRGLGIGILVTALVFIVAGPSELSDEEIIKRAEELGYTKMEEEASPSIGIKELLETGTPAPTNTSVPSPTEAAQATVAPTETPLPTETVVPQETMTPTPEPTLEPTNTPTPQPTATMAPTNTPTPEPTKPAESTVVTATIVIERGNTATVVCNKIEEAGILKDGDDFKKYLINNDLTDYINIGTYTLSSDMSLKEIAELLTGR